MALSPHAEEHGHECELADGSILLSAEFVSTLANATNARYFGQLPQKALAAAPPFGFDGQCSVETVSGCWHSSWNAPNGSILAQGTHVSLPAELMNADPDTAAQCRDRLAEAAGADVPSDIAIRGRSARGFNHRDSLCAEHLASVARNLPCRGSSGLLAHLIEMPAPVLAHSLYASLSVASQRSGERITFRASLTSVLPPSYKNHPEVSLVQSARECPLSPVKGSFKETKAAEHSHTLQRLRCGSLPQRVSSSRFLRQYRHARGGIEVALRPGSQEWTAHGSNIQLLQPLPWFIKPQRRSARGWWRDSADRQPFGAIQRLELHHARLHGPEGLLKIWLQLPPNASEARFEIEYDVGLVHAEEMPPDYGRGLHIAPMDILASPIGTLPNVSQIRPGRTCALLFDQKAILDNGFEWQQSAPGLAHVPLPDPAMRFNAGTLVSAVVASFISAYLTITTARTQHEALEAKQRKNPLTRIRARLSRIVGRKES